MNVDEELLQHHHQEHHRAGGRAATPAGIPAPTAPRSVPLRTPPPAPRSDDAGSIDEIAVVWAAVLDRAGRLGFNGRSADLEKHSPERVLAWICSIEANPEATNPGGLLRRVLENPNSWPPGADRRSQVIVDRAGGAHLTVPPPAAGGSFASTATGREAHGPVLLTTAAIHAAMDDLDRQVHGRHPIRDEINERIQELVDAGVRQSEAFKQAGTEALSGLDPYSVA